MSRMRSEFERASPRSFDYVSIHMSIYADGYSYIGRECCCKVLELLQIRPNLNATFLLRPIFIQQHTKQCLGTASVLDGLCSEPDWVTLALTFQCTIVELSVERCISLWLLVGGVFEEEDDTERIELL